MAAQAEFVQDGQLVNYTAIAAVSAGDVVKLPDGRAGVMQADAAAGELVACAVSGIFKLDKTASIALLAGGDVYWDVSANAAHFRPESGTSDFYVGTVAEDAAAAATTVNVVLNHHHHYDLDMHNSGAEMTTEATLGLGVTVLPGGALQLAFDAVAEAAQAAVYLNRGFLPTKGIAEFRFAVFDIGDNAALDIDIGLASGSDSDNFEDIAAFASFHLDGTALAVTTQSDDGSTDRAAYNSGVSAVDNTYLEGWIDFRDDTDVDFYINGVLAAVNSLPRVLTAALATAMYLIAHMEKTNDDTSAEVRLSRMRARFIGE